MGAIELLRKAKRLDPLDPEAPLFLSKCLSDRVFEPQLFGTNAAKKLAQQAVNLSRRVMHKNPDLPLAHVAYATNCGRLTMFCDNKERVRIAGDVRASALRALQLQPGDDLALHVLGRWEMEMAGLGAVTRAFAKMLYGDLGNGCNHRAATCFRDAAAAQPAKLIHKVCLAKCLLKTGQREEAKAQLLIAMRLKVDDVNALCERKDGVELLRKVRVRTLARSLFPWLRSLHARTHGVLWECAATEPRDIELFAEATVWVAWLRRPCVWWWGWACSTSASRRWPRRRRWTRRTSPPCRRARTRRCRRRRTHTWRR